MPATLHMHQRSTHHTATTQSSDALKPPRSRPPQFPSLPKLAPLPFKKIQHSSVTAYAHAAGQSASSTVLADTETPPLQAELEAAVAAVERACHLCLNVRASIHDDGELDEGDARLKKQDATPVTVADFGVQALISLELRRLFPDVPLLGEEDATQLRNQLKESSAPGGSLAEAVRAVVALVAPADLGSISVDQVLDAIDDGRAETTSQDRFWILDPIDGTRGFLRGGKSQYVIALALVQNGKVVLGVCGCPNMSGASLECDTCVPDATRGPVEEASTQENPRDQGGECTSSEERGPLDSNVRGLIVYASRGEGTWVRGLEKSDGLTSTSGRESLQSDESERRAALDAGREGAFSHSAWLQPQRVRVDGVKRLWDARICISDHETWGELPLAAALASTPHPEDSDDEGGRLHHAEEWEAKQLPLCCGSICKYVAVALGAASVFVQHPVSKPTLKVWDHAAALICVTEAGGQVTDLEGLPLQLGTGESEFAPGGGGVIVTNGGLHELALEAVRKGQQLLVN
ncbi:3(2), 5-bisphosphate nucleotidase [Klebsormidium nitens]|uniref:3(2), 5-bisphosphate nucleotidase n=1 Tax=Klebsormidium nitens TaxID=105231 RepID=A0A0U9HQR8_KLENI|nr:3(2), 5-bisphosphate nucleotidase [Klebsormidium nitens]|eukprot:GAQ81013.1 3(2), 5-bisphosphate nucleotidase [Klebsormidium nitens]